MKQELPKSLREALARQTAGDVHPSADALTAFVEHSLPHRESQGITDHLAQCADCREVVFLAAGAIEEPVGEEQELMPADAVRRISPALLAKAGEAPVKASRRRGWRWWWVWAPAVAVVLIVAGVVIDQRPVRQHLAMTAALKAPVAAPTASAPPSAAPAAEPGEHQLTQRSAEMPAPRKSPARPAAVQTDQKRRSDSRATEMAALQPHEEYSSAATVTATAPPPSTIDALAAAARSATVAGKTQSSFVESEGQGVTTPLLVKPRPNMEKPQTAMRPVSGLRSQWRISSDGHLERSTTPGSWTPVLADQPTTFHVVSVVGSNIWAGGNGGALFHSSDGGQNWSKQPLGGEMGAIVSIRFGDAAHGVVTTDGGSQWKTFDGGASWTKE